MAGSFAAFLFVGKWQAYAERRPLHGRCGQTAIVMRGAFV
ncbi:hypothetical protein [Azospirillum largimobile]